jgi:hypothetical protein
MLEEKRLQDIELANMPPGTRLLGEEERQQTLEELHESKKQLNNILERMPIANKSIAMRKKYDEMEEKQLKIDRAIEMFSKKKVYVAM